MSGGGPVVSDLTARDHARAVCAALAGERDGLDPTGPAWLVKDLELDAALSELFALGPDPEHHREEPWTGPPEQRTVAD